MRIAAQLFFFLILISSSVAVADWWHVGPFEVLGEEYFDGDWEISSEHGDPVKNTKSCGHIRGWVDIIGFENESIINDTHYVNGSAKDFAIVRRNAWHTSVSGTVVSFTTTYSIADGNNTTTATQTTNFRWKYKVYTLLGSYWKHVYEGPLTVSCTVASPEVFNNTIDLNTVTICSYNNSVTPYTVIRVKEQPNIVKIVVEYKNNSHLRYYNRTGVVQTNDRGTEHVAFYNTTSTVNDDTNTIRKLNDVLIINEAPLNWSLLNISVFTPYVEHNDTRWNVTVINSEPLDYINWKAMIAFLSLLLLPLLITYRLIMRIKL